MLDLILAENNRDGYDKDGYDKDGYNSWGYDRNWYDRDGYFRDGYNREGFDKNGYDRDGYDRDGYDKDGYNREGSHKDGFDKDGYDKNGFNRDHINKVTNTEYNIHGFNYLGIHKDTGTEYDPDGFNINRVNKDNFDVNGIHQETNDIWNEEGFNIFHMHKITGTKYDESGFDFAGVHKETNSLWNPKGFSRDGIHKETEAIYDPQGYDIHGNKPFLKIRLKEKNPHSVPFTIHILQGSEIKKELTHSKISEIEKLNFNKNEDIQIKLSLPENNPLFKYEAYLDGTDFSEKTINSNKDMDLFLEIKRKQLLFGKKSDNTSVDLSEDVILENFYALLGIEEDAGQEGIKKAYFMKIKQFPPNKNPELFKKLRKAYDCLSDPHLRNKYDQMRKHGPLIKKLKEAAKEYLEDEEFADAINTLQKILVINSDEEDALMLLYLCYKGQETYLKANEIIKRLIYIDPLNQNYWIEYGDNCLALFSSKSSYDEYKPMEKFLAARDLNPINTTPYLGVATFYFKQEKYTPALEWIDRAIMADKKIDLQDVELFIMKINILISQNPDRFIEIKEVITALKLLKEGDTDFKIYLASQLFKIVSDRRREHLFSLSINLLKEIKQLDPEINEIEGMINEEKKLKRAYESFLRYAKSSVATREFLLILTFLLDRNLYTEEEEVLFEKKYFRQGLKELEGVPVYAIKSAIASIRSNYYDLYHYCRDFFNRFERAL